MKIDGEEFSKDTGYGEKIRQILVQALNQMDQNFPMNASKKGTLAITKEEYKNHFIEAILSVDDIIYANRDDENQYTLFFEKQPVSATYTVSQSKNELGMIPENIIMITNRDDMIYSLLHETVHVDQPLRNSDSICSYFDVTEMLKDGSANHKAEYIRELDAEKDKHISKNGYKLETVLYNKLSYLVGEKEMHQYLKKHDIDLISFLSNKLDKKYGQGTGLAFYQYITNLSLWSKVHRKEVTQEEIDKILEEIETKEQYIREESGQLDENKQQILTINNNYKKMLETIKAKGDGQGIPFDELTDWVRNYELKGLEELTLRCVNQDIEKISSKKEALDYIQLWDYYRNRCLVSEDYEGKEQTSKEWNFESVYKVQHKLYEKCMEYGALNIQDEKLFDCLIESQLYDLSNTTISHTDTLIISDPYLTSEFSISELADGTKQYHFEKQYETDNVKGTKILAEYEQEKEKE